MQKILVIEDDSNVRENIIQLLSEEGYITIEAIDGTTGIKLAKENQPDLIISDILMPGADGFKVLEVLRKEESTSDIPFIFLSARTDVIDVARGLEHKADSYITKPYKAEELLNMVKRLLTK